MDEGDGIKMNKTKNVTLFLILINTFLFSQVNQEWIRRFGNTNGSYSESRGLVIDNNQNVYAGGLNTVNSVNKYAVVKYNIYGDALWSVSYYNPSFDLYVFNSLVLDSLNNIYIIGDCQDPVTGNDIIIVKYNSDGIFQFMKKFDFGGNESGFSAVSDGSGSIYITGYSVNVNSEFITLKINSNGVVQWVKFYYSGEENYHYYSNTISIDRNRNVFVAGKCWLDLNTMDYIIIKYNFNGNLQWLKRFNGPNNNSNAGCRIINDNNGNLYFCGGIDREIADIDISVLKFDQYGNTLWENYYNGSANGTDEPTSITIDKDENVCVTGYSNELNTYADCIVIKYNFAGELQWLSKYNAPAGQYDRGSKIITDESGSIYITGYTENEPVSGYDYLTLRYSPNGLLQWVKIYSGELNSTDLSQYMVLGKYKNIYISGWSELGITTIKYSQVIGIQQISNKIPNEFSLSQNYPNPFNPTTKIRFDLPPNVKGEMSNLKLVIYDVLGREVTTLVNEQLKPGTYEVDFDGSGYASGIYFYSLIIESFTHTNKMVLIK